MTTEHTTTGLIGASIRRVEDRPLITGKGCYTEDIQLPEMLHMALLRSPYPHAKIISIDTNAAQAMAGVITVVTGGDLGEQLHVPAVPMVPGMKIPPHPLLARGAVHAAGTPVAAVVAESRVLALDAANAIDVEYEPLPAVVNAEKALEPGAPLAREELESNLCYVATKKGGDVDKAFAEAEHIVRLRIASPPGGASDGAQRHRGEAGADGGSDGLVVHAEPAPRAHGSSQCDRISRAQDSRHRARCRRRVRQ